MGFWIYMLIITLLFPAIMIFFGLYFKKRTPREINYLFGYRTSRSMKTKETWEFAHKLLGRIWFTAGLVLLPVNIVPMLLVLGEGKDFIGNVGVVLCTVGVITIISTIIPIEIALKHNFNEDGTPKEK